jgi:hypothetical protein
MPYQSNSLGVWGSPCLAFSSSQGNVIEEYVLKPFTLKNATNDCQNSKTRPNSGVSFPVAAKGEQRKGG